MIGSSSSLDRHLNAETPKERFKKLDRGRNTLKNLEIDIAVRPWKVVEEAIDPAQKPSLQSAKCCDLASPTPFADSDRADNG
jgi:hypothetical protein